MRHMKFIRFAYKVINEYKGLIRRRKLNEKTAVKSGIQWVFGHKKTDKQAGCLSV